MDKLIQGTRRERVDVDELRRLKKAGAVYLDPRRTRPLWFDGRFLKAHDLNREQSYFLTRQADLAVATGTGVIEGLQVEAGTTATAIVIRAGHGVTHGGERVLMAEQHVVRCQALEVGVQRFCLPRCLWVGGKSTLRNFGSTTGAAGDYHEVGGGNRPYGNVGGLHERARPKAVSCS